MSSEKIISAGQARKFLHISKRKCAYLLEHQIIPCEITGKKTHRYLVREIDVLAYAERADEIVLPPVFSSAAGRIRPAGRPAGPDPWIMKSRFLQLWENKPDALTPSDVREMTGYVGATVRHWINKGKLRAVTAQNRTLIAKDWLAEFMATDGMRIANKSRVHLVMIDTITRME